MSKNPFRLVAPCDNCPFRRDVTPYLSPGRIDLIRESLTVREQWFPCHKTTTTAAEDGNSAVCVGSLKLVEKMNLRPRFWRQAIALRLYEPGKLTGAAVYDDFDEMRQAQEETKS